MALRKKALTPKDLGLAEDVKLSARYDNTKECFRTVSDQVLGYYVVADDRKTRASIAPIYKADTWVRDGGHTRALISSYEIGQYLNNPAELDVAGNALARIAVDALVALERHAAQRVHLSKRKR